MARIEWVKQRLENWALWKARESGGGLGFSSTTSFLHEVDSSRYREAKIPIDEVDASVTDQGVELLKLGNGHLYETLHLVYIAGVGIRATAARMCRAESTIKSHLDQADHRLASWFLERKRQQQEARQAREAAHETVRARLAVYG